MRVTCGINTESILIDTDHNMMWLCAYYNVHEFEMIDFMVWVDHVMFLSLMFYVCLYFCFESEELLGVQYVDKFLYSIICYLHQLQLIL